MGGVVLPQLITAVFLLSGTTFVSYQTVRPRILKCDSGCTSQTFEYKYNE